MSMRVVLSAFVIVVATAIAAPSAYAAPTGHLSIGICTAPGAGVTIGSTTVDWTPPTGGGTDTGCIVTGVGTSVTFSGGTLTDATTGVIKDLDGCTDDGLQVHAIVLELRVAPDDVGKVIGRQGRIARALRTLVRASGARSNERALLEIIG